MAKTDKNYYAIIKVLIIFFVLNIVEIFTLFNKDPSNWGGIIMAINWMITVACVIYVWYNGFNLGWELKKEDGN